MQKLLNCAIIGVGHIAEKAYINAIKRSKRVKLVAVCDIDKEKAEKIAREFGVPLYTDFQKMLSTEHLDFVINLTPHNVHAAVIKEAAKRHIHVFTEKPLAINLREALLVQKIAKNSGIKVMVGLQRKFNKAYQRFPTMIEKIKNPFFIEARYTMHVDDPSSGWRGSKKDAGGGCLIDMGYHMIDLIIWYFGLPSMVYMESSTKAAPNSKYDTEDTAQVVFNYKNGVYGNLFISRAYRPEEEYFKVTGSNGYCQIDRNEARLFDFNGNEIAKMPVNYDVAALVQEEIESFAQYISGKGKEISSINYNLQHMFFVSECYKSESKKDCYKS